MGLPSQAAKALRAILTDLPLQVGAVCIPAPVREHRFDRGRMWRFDFAYPAMRIAVEIEGGLFIGGRHSRGAGMLKDMEKYNEATLLGWRVLRVTPEQVRNGYATKLVARAIAQRETT
jgi:very-short-patch-repair endonuclease